MYRHEFEYDGITFTATLTREEKSESDIWIFPDKGLYTAFRIEAADSQYSKVSRVISDSEGFSEDTLLKYVDSFKQNYHYMTLSKKLAKVA